MAQRRISRFSTLTLGGIRLVNGVAALLAPRLVARRLGAEKQPATLYVLRLFGIRTVILGLELLFLDGERLQWSIRVAPAIHASDTLAAAMGGASGQLPRRAAVLTTLISATNTALALLAQEPHKNEAADHSNAVSEARTAAAPIT